MTDYEEKKLDLYLHENHARRNFGLGQVPQPSAEEKPILEYDQEEGVSEEIPAHELAEKMTEEVNEELRNIMVAANDHAKAMIALEEYWEEFLGEQHTDEEYQVKSEEELSSTEFFDKKMGF